MRRGWCWGGRVFITTYTCRRSVQACQCHTDPEYPCSAPVSHRTVPGRSSCWQAGRPRTCTRVPLVFATLPDTCVMFTQPCSQPHHHDATGSAPPQTMFTSTHTVSHVFSVHGQHDQPPSHLIVSNDTAEGPTDINNCRCTLQARRYIFSELLVRRACRWGCHTWPLPTRPP